MLSAVFNTRVHGLAILLSMQQLSVLDYYYYDFRLQGMILCSGETGRFPSAIPMINIIKLEVFSLVNNRGTRGIIILNNETESSTRSSNRRYASAGSLANLKTYPRLQSLRDMYRQIRNNHEVHEQANSLNKEGSCRSNRLLENQPSQRCGSITPAGCVLI